MELTKQQRRVVEYNDGDLCVTAGPGSGKTGVIVAKCIDLVRNGLATADRLAVITYTRSAATELRERIESELGTQSASGAAVETIHTWLLAMLKQHVTSYGGYDVIDEKQRAGLIANHEDHLGLDDLTFVLGESAGEPLPRDASRIKLVGSAFDFLRAYGAQITDRSLVQAHLWLAFERYQKLLEERRLFDFCAILAAAHKVLTDTSDLESLHLQAEVSKLAWIMVDEYQDVDHLQHAIICRIREMGVRVLVAADPNQALYRFRGASGKPVEDFQNRCAKAKIPLSMNHRSHQSLVDLSSSFLRKFGMDPVADVAAPSAPYVSGPIGTKCFRSKNDEAEGIAKKILQLVQRGVQYGDIAILFRARRKEQEDIISDYLQALRGKQIPLIYDEDRLLGSSEAWAVILCLDYLASAPYKLPTATKGKAADPPFVKDWLASGWPIERTCVDGLVEYLSKMKATLRAAGAQCDLQAIFYGMLAKLGICFTAFSVESDSSVRDRIMRNLARLSAAIEQFQATVTPISPASEDAVSFVAAFCRWARYVDRHGNAEVDGVSGAEQQNSVRVSTIHGMKSREARIVFLPGLADEWIPGASCGNNLWSIIPREAVADTSLFDATLEDECRAFYVGLTRAQQHLYLSCHKERPPSRFFVACRDWLRSTGIKPDIAWNTPSGSEVGNRSLIFLQATQFHHAAACLFQYMLRDMLGFSPESETAINYGHSLGRIMRKVGDMAKAGMTRQQIDAHVHSLVQDMLFLPNVPADQMDSWRKAARAAVYRQIKTYWDHIRYTAHTEYDTTVRLEGILIEARCDSIERRADGLVDIVEYKTFNDEDEAKLNVAMERAVEETTLLAFGYIQRIERLGKKEAMPAGVWVRVLGATPHDKYVALTDQLMTDVEARIRRVRDAVASRSFSAWQDSDGTPCPCEKCDPNTVCANWQSRTGDGRDAR